MFGGRGHLHGVIAGVLLIGVLAKALQLVNVTSDVVSIITGALLVLSVIAGSVMNWVQAKRVKVFVKPKSSIASGGGQGVKSPG